MRLWSLAVIAVIAVGCGGNNNNNPPPPDSGTPDSGSPGVELTISGFNFPPDFTVDAGTTITVKNNASMSHTVTSEASDNSFTPAAVQGVSFDVTASAGGTATFTIPANAPSGTTIPYYCKFHVTQMSPPNGHITVR